MSYSIREEGDAMPPIAACSGQPLYMAVMIKNPKECSMIVTNIR
jgi:hypothetical protein